MSLIDQLKIQLEEDALWEGEKELLRNEYLIHQGSRNSNLYFVEEGSLRIFITGEDQEQTIRFGYQNSFILALDTFITDQPTQFNIQALKKSKVKWISKEKYHSFIQRSKENLYLWSRLLELLIYQQIEREQDLLTSSPIERYKRVLERSPQLFQEIPNKYIASYLRMTPETLSRIKKS